MAAVAALEETPSTVAAETEEAKDEEGPPHRVFLSESDMEGMPEHLVKLWKRQEAYVEQLEQQVALLKREGEEKEGPQQEERHKLETSRRENLLVMRLTAKEQELQEMAAQIAELKSAQAPTTALLRNTLLDPAVNLLIQKLTKECESLKKQAEEKQNELAAWKFTPDSATGKRLMAKCRQLYQENEEIGKMISSGRLAKLEGELALQKSLTEQMKQNQLEMDDFMAELDEDVEGMQSTIILLQQQLRESKEQVNRLQEQLQQKQAQALLPDPTTQDNQQEESRLSPEPDVNKKVEELEPRQDISPSKKETFKGKRKTPEDDPETPTKTPRGKKKKVTPLKSSQKGKKKTSAVVNEEAEKSEEDMQTEDHHQ